MNGFPESVPVSSARLHPSPRLAPKSKPRTVLIVDDESLIRYSLRSFAEREGFSVLTAETGSQALKEFEEARPEIVILDIKLPDANGISLLKTIKEANPAATVIMITACADIRSTVDAMKLGAADYLEKPIDFDKLSQLLQSIKQDRLGDAKTFSNEDFVFTGESMKEIVRITELLAAKSDLTALVLGESGTGKSLLCRIMHELSCRRDKPFVEIGCSNIPEHLFESELFGYEKGAFTDAKAPKKGLIEMANGGTVFLDEIGDMPYPMQSKILSLIEEKRFRRVGGLNPINADVRIFAATNRNLHDLVQAKKFRLDLYYRLNVATIEIPPLRERKEDIPVLMQHYLRRFSDKYGGAEKETSEQALRFLQDYSWPGNIRELKNLIEKLVILSRGDVIGMDDLPTSLFSRKAGAAPVEQAFAAAGAVEDRGSTGLSLKAMEEEAIKTALKLADGNQRKAARYLDITRDTLRYRLKKLGIDCSCYSQQTEQ